MGSTGPVLGLLTLPIFPAMSDRDVERVIDAVTETVADAAK